MSAEEGADFIIRPGVAGRHPPVHGRGCQPEVQTPRWGEPNNMGRMGGQMFPNNYKRRAVDGDGEKGAGEEGVELGDEGGEEGGGAGGGQEEEPLGQPHRSPDPADRRRAGARGGGAYGSCWGEHCG